MNVVKGDGVRLIAAASLVARWRDHVMEAYAEQYPGYGFESNKGYGPRAIWRAIREGGLVPSTGAFLLPFAAQESSCSRDLRRRCVAVRRCCDASAVGARNETGHSRVTFTVALD